MTDILVIVLRILLIIPAIILHEISHGYVAYMLGDTTAKDAGRLTLNPIAHVDLWGTILLPAMMFFLSQGAFAFGYAKPVPINPNRMYKTNYQTGMLLTGIAGPITNVALALVSGVLFRVISLFALPSIVGEIVYYFAAINLVLAFINLIPIPPLDGSRVVQYFLKGRALQQYYAIERYGFIIVVLLVFILPQYTRFDLIGNYFSVTVYPLLRLFTGVA